MVIFPLTYTIIISFFDYTLGKPLRFNYGLNFLKLASDYRFFNGLKLSFIFVAIVVTVEFLLGLGLAVILSGKIRGRRLIRLIMLMPMFACPIAVGYLNLMLLSRSGPITSFLNSIGITAPNFLGDPKIALYSVAAVDIWEWTPFMFLVLLAGLESLPVEPFEAARVDGASDWMIFKRLTLPMLTPTILIALVLRLTDAFKVFDIFVGLTKGGPGTSTEIYAMYTFRVALEYFKFGYAAAMSLVFLVMMMIIVNVMFYLAGKVRR
jgi:multiple sugar transport system permease protein